MKLPLPGGRLATGIVPDECALVVQDGGLSRNVSIVRKALGRDPEGQDYIETVPKLGYRFVNRVRRLDASSAMSVVMEKTTVSHIITVEEEVLTNQGRTDLSPMFKPQLQSLDGPLLIKRAVNGWHLS